MHKRLAALFAALLMVLPVCAEEQRFDVSLYEDFRLNDEFALFAPRVTDEFQWMARTSNNFATGSSTFNWKEKHNEVPVDESQVYVVRVLEGSEEGLHSLFYVDQYLADTGQATLHGGSTVHEVQRWGNVTKNTRVAFYKPNTLESVFGKGANPESGLKPSPMLIPDIADIVWVQDPGYPGGWRKYFVNSAGEWRDADAPFGPDKGGVVLKQGQGIAIDASAATGPHTVFPLPGNLFTFDLTLTLEGLTSEWIQAAIGPATFYDELLHDMQDKLNPYDLAEQAAGPPPADTDEIEFAPYWTPHLGKVFHFREASTSLPNVFWPFEVLAGDQDPWIFYVDPTGGLLRDARQNNVIKISRKDGDPLVLKYFWVEDLNGN